MSDLKNLTALVIDSGQFYELALRLAREDGFGRVLYHNDLYEAYPRVQTALIGDGDPGVERISEIWPLPKIDCAVIVDCAHPGLQEELRSRGIPVWGSGEGVFLEWRRIQFRETLKGLGLPVHPYTVIEGLSELRSHLWGKENQYIRFSRFRGNRETMHWIHADLSMGELDALAVELGPAAERMRFLVESAFGKYEVGYDGYFSGGKFPGLSFHGIEEKDKAYFGAVVSKADLPPSMRIVNEALEPLLAKLHYENFISTEIRIDEDGTPFFTDPTCRQATPAGEPLLEAFANLPEIVWAGANGGSLDPVCDVRFAAQVLIEHADSGEDQWRYLEVPRDVRRWVKLYNPVRCGDEVYAFPSLRHSCTTVGSVLGLGNTPEEAVDAVKEHAAALDGQAVTVPIETLASALAAAKEAEGEGVEMGGQPVPDGSIALPEAP